MFPLLIWVGSEAGSRTQVAAVSLTASIGGGVWGGDECNVKQTPGDCGKGVCESLALGCFRGLGVCGDCPGHTCGLGFSSGLENPLQNISGVHPLDRDPQRNGVPEPLHLPFGWNRIE